MTREELKSLMRIPANASKEMVMQTFERIAEVLMNGCVIKFQNEEYRILDFEFYYYNKNHQDISVHPRNSKALCWYINDFGGIDLNFESNINKKWLTQEQADEARKIIAAAKAEGEAQLKMQMIENIAKGRVQKFLKENCLVDQEFQFGDGDKATVTAWLAQQDKELKIAAFRRFTLVAE